MRRRDVIRTAALGAAALAAGPAGAEGWTPPPKGAVRMIETVFIPMPDGVRLAVQLWLPEGAEAHPAPVVLEYIPYRKRDRYRAYGMYWGRTLAERGIAYARLETRGSGDSTGLLEDEYLPRHHHDAAEAIAMAGGPALVQRIGGHARRLLGRLQHPADRRPDPAGAQGHHAPLRLRSPLHR